MTGAENYVRSWWSVLFRIEFLKKLREFHFKTRSCKCNYSDGRPHRHEFRSKDDHTYIT